MDRITPYFHVGFSFLLVVLVQTSMVTGQNFPENNIEDDLVTTITTMPGVTLSFSDPSGNPDNAFRLEGNQLLAAVVLDYETVQTYTVGITCRETENQENFNIIVVVINENDNPPAFDKALYETSIKEMSPVGTTVDRFAAFDPDQSPEIYYSLTSESSEFKLKSATIPEVLVDAHLDYDKVKNVQLVLEAQDTPLGSPSDMVSFTATTTIMITITDVDNRPPWFQPCTTYQVSGAVVCRSSGYTGMVVLNEQETGVLPLKPGPLYAIDGDFGINEEITYSFLSGNEDDLFDINPVTGNITMLRPTDVLGSISLTILVNVPVINLFFRTYLAGVLTTLSQAENAAQKINSHQLATTSVTISIQVKSLHPPQFQRLEYEALVTAVGTMAMDLTNTEELLQILATDEDYAGTGGVNPHVTYSVVGSSDFSIISGYLFMTKDLLESTWSLVILATDTSNDETATAELIVEVKSGLTTTTSIPPSTTEFRTTTSPVEFTRSSSITSESAISTAATEGSSFTTSTHFTETWLHQDVPDNNVVLAWFKTVPRDKGFTECSKRKGALLESVNLDQLQLMVSTSLDPLQFAYQPHLGIENAIVMFLLNQPASSGRIMFFYFFIAFDAVIVSGDRFAVKDIAALGASLGILLFVCLVVIGVLAHHMRRGKAYWRKIYEASKFRSSVGQGSGGPKEGIQYTNEAFERDEDGSSVYSGDPEGDGKISVWDTPPKEATQRSSESLYTTQLPDDASDTSSNIADKEVKPILTKERRTEEGYKAVWFKEDIDPNAKEEVVIIPDSREEDSEKEDEEPSSSRREDKDYNPKPSKVVFAESDLDSGLKVKIGDLAEDSESNQDLNIDL
ncbi:uncharacterized protein FYW49_020854 [Xenentodon cancila]